MTGDHFPKTCPKPKKKEDPNRLVTPYHRARSASKEQGGASQGGKTQRMLQGSFGSKSWTAMSRQQGPADPPSNRKEIESNDEDEDEQARNEEIANQWLIDDVVKELIEMGLKQIEKGVDTEGFEAGSEHWLKF